MPNPTIPPSRIQRECDLEGRHVLDVIGPSREMSLAHARGRIMRRLHGDGYSLAEIGRKLQRHHTTVLYWVDGCR
jgi:chromosomal replication initiation ATPase DnaA